MEFLSPKKSIRKHRVVGGWIEIFYLESKKGLRARRFGKCVTRFRTQSRHGVAWSGETHQTRSFTPLKTTIREVETPATKQSNMLSSKLNVSDRIEKRRSFNFKRSCPCPRPRNLHHRLNSRLQTSDHKPEHTISSRTAQRQ